MFRVSTGASFGLRCGIVTLASALALVMLNTTPADARKRKSVKRPAAAATYEPRYADIVVDANTGDVLHSTNPDARRHPASLTKIMTLYLLFEQIEAGRIKLDTPMHVSTHASLQSPTKLGVRAGQTLMVEDAIKALVTKSANDAAVVVAEALAGSEEEFAKLMTRKARALRMSRTVYKNASGLPDPDQITTARDQALLGLAIQDRFPRYYRYFATESFAYRGVRMANHNRLLGRVQGVDGIKTGYTRASGFNLVSSVRRGDRRIVAVVLGGASGGARDAKMRSLIEQKVVLASTRRTAPKITEIADAAPMPMPQPERPVRVASVAGSVPTPVEAPRTTSAVSADQPSLGSTDPIRPLLVKTLSVRAGAVRTASAPMSLLAPEPMAARAPMPAPETVEPARQEAHLENRTVELKSDGLPPPPPGARPGVLGVLPANDAGNRIQTASIAPAPAPAPKLEARAAARTEAQPAVSESKPRSGWSIQIGAFDDQSEAREKLANVQSKIGGVLKNAEPYTETFAKGDKRFYRARFAGLQANTAEQACRQLKRNHIACFAIRN